MKTIERPNRYALVALAFALVGGLLGACEDEKGDGTITDPTGPSTPIQIETIIATPKAASPGDTIAFSAIVVSSSPNEGDIPEVTWTASGGSFLEDNTSSVRWVAPGVGMYRVTARAKNTANTVSKPFDLFVGATEVLVNNQAGQVFPQANGTDIYYLRSSNIASGVEVYSLAGDVVTTPESLDGSNNRSITLASNLSFEAHSFFINSFDSTDNGILHIFTGNFTTGEFQRISTGSPNGFRFPAFNDPAISPDNRYVAYGGMLPTAMPSPSDSFDIFVYDTQGPTRQRVTESHTNHHNTFPSWSTDRRWLTFVSDRSARVWEIYGMPVNVSGVINTAQASLVRLSNTGGTIAVGNPGGATFRRPPMKWSPVAPNLAVLASDGTLYIIKTTPSGATQVDFPGFESGKVVTFAWSPDGQQLAAATAAEVLLLSSDGTSRSLLVRSGDSFSDLSWSPDSAWLLYRVTRGGSSWFEIFDIDGTTLPTPVPVTEAVSAGNLGAYRAVMSMSGAWSSANLFFYPTFETGFGTPGIAALDMSGLLSR